MASESGTSRIHEGPAREADPIQAAREYGIDVSMLADSLGRSVAERLRRHEIARRTARALQRAKAL